MIRVREVAMESSILLETYKKHINKGWYGSSISTLGLDGWVSNFKRSSHETGFDPTICAAFLLNSLIYYQESQTIAIIASIVNRLKSQLNAQEARHNASHISEMDLRSLWEEYQSECLVIAAARPGDTASSANQISRLWRNNTNLSVEGVESIKESIENREARHIFFVDDFIGTGTKMSDFMSEKIFANKSDYSFTNIKEMMDHYPNVDFNIAVIALHQAGKKKLYDEFPNVSIFYGDYYDHRYDLLSPECVFYDTFEQEKQQIIDYIKNKQNELDSQNQYALNLPIAFQHGCPNNTLSLYYTCNEGWSNLLTKSNPR